MCIAFLRQLVVVVTLGAFLNAGAMQLAFPLQAAPADMAMMTPADGTAPMPCKDMMPICMTDLGCVLMIGLPSAPPALTMTLLFWSRVHYGEPARLAEGLTRKPALDPPIFIG